MYGYTRINSPIVKLFWAGWESNTLALQRAGWNLAVEEDMATFRVRIALRHPDLRLYGVSAAIDYYGLDSQRRLSMAGPQDLVIPIQHMASKMEIHCMDNLSNFHAIDAEPSFITNAPRSIEDYKIFRSIRQAEQQIIVPQHSVPELLEQILKMQDPKQKEIRENRRREIRKFMREAVNIEAGTTNERVAAEILVGV